MKVLLLGEYSGLHNNLKEGLLELGHDAVLASSGDGWKKIKSDLSFGHNGESLIYKLSRAISYFKNIKNFIGYDAVQFVNPVIFNTHISSVLLDIILKSKKNKRTFLLAAGCDGVYSQHVKKLAYSPCNDCRLYDLNQHRCHWDEGKYKKINYKLACGVDGVIPIMYDYALGYRNFHNLKETIPIPINTDKLKYEENIPKSKLTIFHGLNREGFKGTKIILKALEIIKNKYAHDVEIIVSGRMSLNKYLEIIKSVNIVVDQCFSYSYGVNAACSMALGKLVLSGCEKECLEEFKIESCPVINIRPSVDDIVGKIGNIIDNKKLVSAVGFESRKFVEGFHNYIKIAQKYVDIWNN